MKSVRLLVLGALRRRGRAHGYQVRADLEAWGAHEWSTATSGSVYHALKSMAGQGLLVTHETVPSEAGGPPRIEYELTGKGDTGVLRPASPGSRRPRTEPGRAGRRRRPDRGPAPRAGAADAARASRVRCTSGARASPRTCPRTPIWTPGGRSARS